jgi:hypothetical protein
MEDLPSSWIGTINIAKISILPKPMFNANTIKIPMTFCTEIEKSVMKYIWKHKRHQIAKEVLIKKRHHNT